MLTEWAVRSNNISAGCGTYRNDKVWAPVRATHSLVERASAKENVKPNTAHRSSSSFTLPFPVCRFATSFSPLSLSHSQIPFTTFGKLYPSHIVSALMHRSRTYFHLRVVRMCVELTLFGTNLINLSANIYV